MQILVFFAFLQRFSVSSYAFPPINNTRGPRWQILTLLLPCSLINHCEMTRASLSQVLLTIATWKNKACQKGHVTDSAEGIEMGSEVFRKASWAGVFQRDLCLSDIHILILDCIERYSPTIQFTAQKPDVNLRKNNDPFYYMSCLTQM